MPGEGRGRPAPAQNAAIAGYGGLCNDDWASLGVMSGHERKTLRLSVGLAAARLPSHSGWTAIWLSATDPWFEGRKSDAAPPSVEGGADGVSEAAAASRRQRWISSCGGDG